MRTAVPINPLDPQALNLLKGAILHPGLSDSDDPAETLVP
jgi:hypothetical protein